MDTQQYVAKFAVATIAILSVVGVLGLLGFAVFRDGDLAPQIISTIEGYLQLSIPALATLTGLHTIANAVANYKAQQPPTLTTSTPIATVSVSTAAPVTAPANGGEAS